MPKYTYDLSLGRNRLGEDVLLKLPRGRARPGMIARDARGEEYTLTNVLTMGEDLSPMVAAMERAERAAEVRALLLPVWRVSNEC